MNEIEEMNRLIEKKYAEILAKADNMVVTKDSIPEAVDLTKQVKQVEKNFLDKFEAEKKRRYEYYQEYQKKYKKFLDLIEKYNSTIRKKMLSIDMDLDVIKEILKEYDISVIDNWKAKIDDASEIPREYMVPDTKKINKVVSAMKEETDIPGVRPINYPYIRIS